MFNSVFFHYCVWISTPIIALISVICLDVVRYCITIYICIYQSFAVLSDKLDPLVDGVRQNKLQWLELATTQNHNSKMEDGDEQWFAVIVFKKYNAIFMEVRKILTLLSTAVNQVVCKSRSSTHLHEWALSRMVNSMMWVVITFLYSIITRGTMWKLCRLPPCSLSNYPLWSFGQVVLPHASLYYDQEQTKM
jgi:hypothetical protein